MRTGAASAASAVGPRRHNDNDVTMTIFGLWRYGDWRHGTTGCTALFVLDGEPAPPERGHSPQVLAHAYCGQTAWWIKMPLGMEVGLGPGDFVLDGDPASRQKRGTAPNFRPFLLWQNGWMDQDATWYGGRPRPRPHCVRWGPSSPSPSKKGAQPHNFLPMSIVAIRLDGSRCHLVRRYASAQATLC